jgi:hypothetical protein
MAWVGGDIAHRLGRGAEQDGIGHTLALEGDLRRRHRQGEDDMEVRHWQQLGLPCLEPSGPRQALTLRAMPVAARIVGAANQPAIVALFDMPAERRCPAGPDRCHYPLLDPTEMLVMPIAERRAVAAEDIRHLQAQMVERAQRATDGAGRNLRIARRGVDVAMTEQPSVIIRTILCH